MTPRSRGGKRWSSWDLRSYAELTPDHPAAPAHRRRPTTPAERQRRRRHRARIIVAIVTAIAGLVVVRAFFGRKTADGIVALGFVCVSTMIVIAPPVGDRRTLLRLRKSRVLEAERLASSGQSVASDPELLSAYRAIVDRRPRTTAQLRRRAGFLSSLWLIRAHPASAKCATLAILSVWVVRPIADSLDQHAPPLALLLSLTPFALFFAAVVIHRRAGRRLIRALDGLACPDCGYPLDALPPRVPAPAGESATIGPERCPECGCPWPLVPPQPVEVEPPT